MSEGEDVGGTVWGRMSEGGNPRDGRSGIFPERGVGRAEFVKGLVYFQTLCVFLIGYEITIDLVSTSYSTFFKISICTSNDAGEIIILRL